MTDNDKELILVQEIADGCLDSWHAFVDQYSGLILCLVRRYLARESEDDRRTVYVEVLRTLHAGKLSQYDGRTKLSTWVGIVTRSCSLDHLRRLYGRRDPPRWLQAFPERDREIYRLYHLEGWSLRRICLQMSARGSSLSVAELVATLGRFEEKMDRRTRRRIAYDLRAQEMGPVSGRLMEYLDYLSAELDEKARALSPERKLERREAAEQIERLRGLLRRLPALEQKVLSMHYMDGRTARQIFNELELRDQRRVYTLIDRGLRQLGVMFKRQSETKDLLRLSASKKEPGTTR